MGMSEKKDTSKQPAQRWRIYACKDARLVGETAEGSTKGEARAAIRRRFGLDRLPQGTGLEKVK